MSRRINVQRAAVAPTRLTALAPLHWVGSDHGKLWCEFDDE